MLGDITAVSDIYIICGYTDMRKSIDGLCAIIKDQLDISPEHSNALYLFCGRKSDRIKAILHEKDGFVLPILNLNGYKIAAEDANKALKIMIEFKKKVDNMPKAKVIKEVTYG